MRVLVTGATGFIGRAVVPLLLKEGHAVTAFSRGSAAWPFPAHPACTRVGGDVRDPEAVRAAMHGADAVIHLAARKSDEPDSNTVNIEGARIIAACAKAAVVRRIVNVSTQSARLGRKGAYGSTKAAADELLQASDVPVVTLRSSLVYGESSEGVFGSIVTFAKLPAIPVFGPGTARFRPIHRDDLARVILAALEAPDAVGRTYDVGGPDEISFNDLIRSILAARGMWRPILHLPVGLGLLAARVLAFLPKPPITASNVLGGAEDVPMDVEPMLRDFGVRPRAFRDGLGTAFPPASDGEAELLLSYAFPKRGFPGAAALDRYRSALAAQRVDPEHRLDAAVVRHRFMLGPLDAATRVLRPRCALQKKLLIAAAIAETDAVSADALLPRDRGRAALVIHCALLSLQVALKWIGAALLLPFPLFLRRNAGH